jgi:hypothetical protein
VIRVEERWRRGLDEGARVWSLGLLDAAVQCKPWRKKGMAGLRVCAITPFRRMDVLRLGIIHHSCPCVHCHLDLMWRDSPFLYIKVNVSMILFSYLIYSRII